MHSALWDCRALSGLKMTIKGGKEAAFSAPKGATPKVQIPKAHGHGVPCFNDRKGCNDGIEILKQVERDIALQCLLIVDSRMTGLRG